MRNYKLILTIITAIFVSLTFLGCEGDTGPKGPQGPAGEDGADATLGPPDDRVFALAVFNGTQRDHNGNNTVTLTFDTTAVPSGNVVVGNKVDNPPMVDGVDDGSDFWGTNISAIEMSHQAYADNFIDTCYLRCAYTDYAIYFQLKWTETEQGQYTVGEDTSHLPWSYNGSAGAFERLQEFEDKVALFFPPDEPKQFWEDFGCLTACHLGDGDPDYMRSTSGTDLIDVWQWSAARSQGTGIGFDRVLTNIPFNGFIFDGGVSPLLKNYLKLNDTIAAVPTMMHKYQLDDPSYVPEDPMLEYFAVPFVDTLDWQDGDMLPTWILQPPSEGNDLIMAEGKFDNGTWVVEFSRIRRTKDIYDANF